MVHPLKRNVLIIGPDTGGIPQSVTKAFRNLGWDADLFAYSPPHMSFFKLAINRLVVDPNSNKAAINSFNESLRKGAIPLLKQKKFDFFLIVKGNYLDDDNKEIISNTKIPIILWTLDSLSRAPYQKNIADMAARTFYVDGGDIPGNDGGKSSWLPLGYDRDLYHPGLCFGKNMDVLLIGTVGGYYKRRLEILNKIAKSDLSKKWRCGFIGSTGTLTGTMSLYFHYKIRQTGTVQWISRRVSADELAKAISGSKICINIHQDDGITPVNPMFFAIPGTGTCMLAENKKHLHQWLKVGEEYVEFEDDDLLITIERLLNADKEREGIAYRGYEASLKHTFESRVTTILQRMEYGI